MSCADLRVLFAAAAGPRRGFGHLVRCRSLARAMGVRPLVAVRGGPRVVEAASVLGCEVVPRATPATVATLRPDVLVVDDPIARTAAAWVAAGRRAGCLVVSIHDRGIGCLEGDLVVDGSVTRTARAAFGRTLAGPRYAVLDPALRSAAKGKSLASSSIRVLISLGGGPRATRARAIADAIARLLPQASIRVIGGLSGEFDSGNGRVAWVSAPRGLQRELAAADVVVVGGGVTLYEACALGVPAVGVPVVRAQEPTVVAFVRRRAALGVSSVKVPPQTIAEQVARLATEPATRERLARRARALVDGRGAERVASAIAGLHARQCTNGRRGTRRCTCAD